MRIRSIPVRQMRSGKGRTVSGLALVVMLAGAAATGQSPADARPHAPAYYAVDIRSHQFNMCSANASNCGSVGGVGARDLVHWFNNSDSAWAISLNEMCYADLVDLSNRTGKPGYMFVARNSAANCPGTTKWFGNGILTYSPVVSGTPAALRFSDQETPNCNPSSNECRGAVCVTFGSYAGNVTACSAHMENSNVPVATDQAIEYRFWATQRYPGGRWLAGDFNLTPTQVPSGYSSQYYRAPSANTSPASSPNKQIDYVWHDKAHSAFNTLRSPHCDPYYSDHCYVFARFG